MKNKLLVALLVSIFTATLGINAFAKTPRSTENDIVKPAHPAVSWPTTMTCKEFLALDEVIKPKVVYWAEGFDKKGKPDQVIFDIASIDHYYPVFSRRVYCLTA
jgi:hypothetical protein